MMKQGLLRKTIAYSLIASLLLVSGCSKKVEVPELLEPVSNNEAYRPAEYGTVLTSNIMVANVVPEDYPVFFTEAATVEEICVDDGEYVEEGTVIAKINTDNLSEELEQKKLMLSNENATYEYNKKIIEEQITIQQYLKKDAQINQDTEAEKECDEQIKILQENARYEELLNKHKNTVYSERINELSKKINQSVLVADHSGYVSFIKNLSSSASVQAYENVAIISDMDELHLELSATINDALYKMIGSTYDSVYILINVERKYLKLKTYTNEELVAIESSSAYPNITFDLENDDYKLSIGDQFAVYITSTNNKECLRIGIDSLYTNGNKNFVYVKTETGKEQREIEIGNKSDIYAEVLSGLEEGELVYYSSKSAMPEKYETYEIKLQTYEKSGSELGLKGQYAYTELYPYNWYEECVVDTVYVSKWDEVKKGDLLCTLKTTDGSARRVELQSQINELSETKNKTLKGFDESLEAIDKQIANARNAKNGNANETDSSTGNEELATSTDAPTGFNADEQGMEKEKTTVTLLERLNCERNILEYRKEISKLNFSMSEQSLQLQYQKACEKNDGKGYVYIYATQDGSICQVSAYEGKKINAQASALFQICNTDNKKILFSIGESYVGVGRTVKMVTEDGNEYTTTVVGTAGVKGKKYVCHKDGKVYMTSSNAESKVYASVEGLPEDLKTASTDINYVSVRVPDTVVIPIYMLHEENNYYMPNTTLYYVWKVVDGNLVKQYVDTKPELNSKSEACIFEGVKEGDVLAYEKVGE